MLLEQNTREVIMGNYIQWRSLGLLGWPSESELGFDGSLLYQLFEVFLFDIIGIVTEKKIIII